MTINAPARYDLCIVGGGVNGCGIARDAAGRGLRLLLCEKDDLAQATSSASTKLFHGGLRYLEQYEFRLVREALKEREVLLSAMPHISWPMRFVLPHHQGLRPAWLLRLGLFIYDNLGGRKILPGTKTLDLGSDAVGAPLKDSFRKGFEYSDCWVEDSRLVVLNARDAADRGAEILTRTAFVSAEPDGDGWQVDLQDTETGGQRRINAKVLVNAAGPWVEEIARNRARLNTTEKIRLVRGSHIVVKKLFDHDRAYIFQHADGRVIFAIPYEQDFTLIGTTDADHEDLDKVECTQEEAMYLCDLASEYFEVPVQQTDIVHTYAGVRPLYDDGSMSATKATRDYVLKLERQGTAPILNVFGGKITTYRKLAEEAMEQMAPALPGLKPAWTAGKPLPGGDFAVDGVAALEDEVAALAPWLDARTKARLVRAYGTDAKRMLGQTKSPEDLGRDFGHGLTEVEVRWLMDREWARTTDDILWRRSKLGLRLTREEVDDLDQWMNSTRGDADRPEVA
ncbi:MAG: glycerol-3-phosphate dehydrogenase [Pseudomonadota bacterium]